MLYERTVFELQNGMFSEPYYLRIHNRKHTGERPLICEICDKSFADPRSLKAHNMMHSGEKQYKCHIC
ncbi:hypothetical protein NQ314_014185, partial [Rhamnusium bicolor]